MHIFSCNENGRISENLHECLAVGGQGNRVWAAENNGAPHICAFSMNLLEQGLGREASRR
jgi:hypothetical protein